MKLLTWNGRFGKASRAWPSLVERLGIDVAFLQEVSQPSSSFTFLWEAVPGYEWGTAVVAGHGRFEAIHVAGYDGWVVGGALIRTGVEPLYVFSVHAPTASKSARRGSYVAEIVKHCLPDPEAQSDARGCATRHRGRFQLHVVW